MTRRIIYLNLVIVFMMMMFFSSCIPVLTTRDANKKVSATYNNLPSDTTNTGAINWKEFFTDPFLSALIDTALSNNQELNMMRQQVNITQNEIRARKGAYLPFVSPMVGVGVDKVGAYTLKGAGQEISTIKGSRISDPVGNFVLGAFATWEVDIWRKLRNARKSAIYRYLATIEGKNFMITNLVAEIANSYYELMALDNQLDVLKKNIEIQTNALAVIKLQKQAARVTELAVRRFEALVFNTRSRQYDIQQRIIEAENKINFLLGRYPQTIQRNSTTFNTFVPKTISAGVPSQLLINRTDIRRAEQELEAAKIDVKVARANFYPSLVIMGGVGFEAFKPQYLLQLPESLLFSVAGNLIAPLINRNALKAEYYSSNARQKQAVFNYERTILNGYIEVVNQVSNISNLQNSYDLKSQEVQALVKSVETANILFKSANADYVEVLLTQRDATESSIDLIEIKKQQMHAMVNVYRALGGGWR